MSHLSYEQTDSVKIKKSPAASFRLGFPKTAPMVWEVYWAKEQLCLGWHRTDPIFLSAAVNGLECMHFFWRGEFLIYSHTTHAFLVADSACMFPPHDTHLELAGCINIFWMVVH